MRSAIALLLLALTAPLAAVTPYQFGALPSVASDADLNSAYSTWKSRRFKTITCGQPMAWVDNGRGWNPVFSEGQAYGLLMAAYLDANSADFTRLWRFYEMRMDSRGLMNWEGPGDCTGNNGTNAATDADLDAAIALIRAHRRWPAEGWGAKATTLLNNIYTHMVDGCQGLKNGDTWGGCSSGANNAYNPSYFRTGYMNSFNCFEGSSRWTPVRNRSYTVANHAYNNYALPPDWVKNDGTWGQATNSGGYGYDSCRSPWTFVQDYLWWGNATGQNWGRKIGLVFGNKAPWNNPAAAASDVGDDYSYSSGAKVRGNHENAFIGGAAISFMATTHTAQLNAFYSNLVFTDNNSYYSDSLKVIYLMILTGAFQEPCYGPGPIPTATPTATPTNYAGTPTMTPMPAFGIVFDDFESGITGNYGYPAAVQAAQSRSAAAAHAGAYGYNVGPANLAAGGVGFNSTYAVGGVVDATGAVSLRFWVKSDVNTSFQVDWYEAGATGAPVAGGDGEAWVSAPINVVGGSGWQQIVIPIAGMTEEVYNGGCNPTYACGTCCTSTGNNTKNLSAADEIQVKFTLGTAATVQFDDFEFVLGTQPSPTFTRTPFFGSMNQVFDDMETTTSLRALPLPAYGGGYADTANGASASMTKSTATLPPGAGNTTAGLLTYNTGGAASYGAGGYLLSPYSDASLVFDASGAVFIGLWVNAPAGLAYRIAFQEAGSPTSPTAGAEGEAYQSALQIADGGWEFVQLEVNTFNEDLYNPLCNPTGATPANCTATGDGVRDFQGIASVTLKLDGNQGAGNFYFDDVVFVTNYKSPTPTRSATPTASFTRTPSPSFSPTATVSPSSTPSASPSGTPSATPMGSATFSPTETLYAGSPTDTPAPSATPTMTLTVTASYSSTITLSHTFSHTPQPGSPTFTPSITLTGTRTPTVAIPSNTASPSHTPPPSPTRTETPNTAMIQDLAFTWTPNQLTVTAGTNVTWAWVGTHDVESDTGLFSSGSPVAGGSFNYTFNTPGTYRYYCSAHGNVGGVGMSGIIYVTGGAPTPTNSPTTVVPPTATFSPTTVVPATPTFSPTAGTLPTATPVGAPSTPIDKVVLDTAAFPNPILGGRGGSIRVQLAAPVDGLSLNVYSAAMTLMATHKLGALPGGWVDIALPASVLNLPAGSYFYAVRATRNGSPDQSVKGGRLLLLR